MAMVMVTSLLSKFIFPPSSLIVSAMSVISFVSMARTGYLEIKGKNLPYSKFWNFGSADGSRTQQIELSSKAAMLIGYIPAFLTAVASFWVFPNQGFRTFILQSALTLHFSKRIFEVLFVHKYSGGMKFDTVIHISVNYFLSTATMLYAQHLTLGLPEPPIDLKYPGIVLFLIGIGGNFYHHCLLSKLRRKGMKEYKIPEGGLFGLVVCPHYLFEIIGFYGISFISQTIYPFSFAIGSNCYLIGRSYATRRWYLSKFEDFPRDVKAIIPFIL